MPGTVLSALHDSSVPLNKMSVGLSNLFEYEG